MYQSTRGTVKNVSFEDVLLSGYCSDGGIFVPKSIPQIPRETMKTWSTLPFTELVKKLVPMFILEDDIPKKSLSDLIDSAFSRFSNGNIVELKELSNGLKVMELFYGPTFAFKDISMVCLGQLLEFCLSRKKQHATIVVGTSGDTGGSAIEALRGLDHLDLIVLLPGGGRCTEVQELQMVTATDKNVHCFRVDGSSDELDLPIRRCFLDSEFAVRHNLASINSLNWSRVMIQIANFFAAYFKVCPSCDEEVEIVVPTGACGHVAAACFARKMGLPIKMICAVNSNDFMTRLIDKGIYSVEGPLNRSLAPAMDIQMAYNVERLLWIFSDGDSELVRSLMDQFERTLQVQIPPEVHRKMKDVIGAHRVDDNAILEAMRRCWEENQYIVCPHTATAVHYHYYANDDPSNSSNSGSPAGGSSGRRKSRARVCFATASPLKFRGAVTSAGIPSPSDALLDALKLKAKKCEEMKRDDDWYEVLRSRIVQITDRETRH